MFSRSRAEPLPPFCDALSGRLCEARLRQALALGADALGVFPAASPIGGVAYDELDPLAAPGA